MVPRLTRGDEPALRELLASDPAAHVLPWAILEQHGIESPSVAFYGQRSGATLEAAILVCGRDRGRFAVPVARSASDAAALGDGLRGHVALQSAVGPRAAVDALWAACGSEAPRVLRSHRLFRITAEEMGPLTAPLRLAETSDLPEVIHNAAAMQLEDLGVDPLAADPSGFRDRMATRVSQGRVWILREEGEIAFQVEVAATCGAGGLLEGVYTPPVYRGLGFASRGLGQLCRTLLARLPQLTLHVNEANPEASTLVRKLGFLPGAPFRVVSVD